MNRGTNSKTALGQRWLFHYVNMILFVNTREMKELSVSSWAKMDKMLAWTALA